MARFCEYSNESSISIEGAEFLDQLSCCQFIKKNQAPLSQNNNSIQFFIIGVLHQQPEGQLQM
jgi:hypothetical protein